MRVSLLACVAAACVLLLVGPVCAEVSDLECHGGNSGTTTGLCDGPPSTTNNPNPTGPFLPTWNKDDGSYDSASYETDVLFINNVNIRTDGGAHEEGLLDVHRIIWADSNSPGIGNTPRNVSSTIGRTLPAGFLEFPFQTAYRADGLYLQPRPDTLITKGQTVTSMSLTISYKFRGPPSPIDQPAILALGNSQVWLLFQPLGGLGFTAGPETIVGKVTNGRTSDFGPSGTLPNGGVGTYFLTRRIVTASINGSVTGNIDVSSGTTLQAVGGPNAPNNFYNMLQLSGPSNPYDMPVLNLTVPAVNGAFLTFTLSAIEDRTPAAGKVFISSAIFTLKSVTPEDSSVKGVALSGTYTLDTTATPAPAASYVAGSQKLYVRPSGTSAWNVLPTSQFNQATNEVSYALAASDANSFGSVVSLEMTVQADIPVSSSSTGESSSSSSTAEESSSSSSAEASSSSVSSSSAPQSSSSSSAAPSSSSSAAPSSSSSSVSSSTGRSSSSSSSSTAPAASSSSSTGVSSSSAGASSSSTGVSSSSSGVSSSSTGESSSSSTAEPIFDGSATTVGVNGVGVALAAAAAVMALYA